MTEISARFQLDWPGFHLAVDVQLPVRGVSALFGPSGSGKTSLLRCLAGLERAPGGHLRVRDEIWQNDKYFRPAHQRPIGYVFQEPSLFPHLSVASNLHYGRRRRGASLTALEQAVSLLGIEPLLERSTSQLSGGERQRVAIARALATNPRLLLMDEPLAALDLARKREVLPYLERLHQSLDIPVVYVTHSPEEVARLADTLVLLEAGQVRAAGPLAEVLSRTELSTGSAGLGAGFGIGLDEEAGALVAGRVDLIEPQWHLARVSFAGGQLWLSDNGLTQGQSVRLWVLARDVSLATSAPVNSSIQNQLQGRLEAIEADRQPGQALVRIRVAETLLLARVTQRALAQLELQPGDHLWLQVKSAALME